MSSLGIFAQECSPFLEMLDNLGLGIKYQTYCIRRMINIAIRSTYNIFCRRNKEWESPDLLTVYLKYLIVLYIYIYLLLFLLVFFLGVINS